MATTANTTKSAQTPLRSGGGRGILLLTPSLDYGGAEVAIVHLAKFLAQQDWRVCVVSMLPPRAFVETVKGFGASVISLDMSRRGLNLRGIGRLIRIVKQFKPALIHAHMFHANILARLLRPLLQLPVICTVQNILESARDSDTAGLRDWAYRSTDWGCTRTTTVAEAATKRHIESGLTPARKIETIPNGVDTSTFTSATPIREATRATLDCGNAFAWLAVGRLELAKDFPTLIEAFQSVHVRDPGALLFIAGTGRLRAELEDRVVSAGLSSCIRFLGLRTDVLELMNACDAFVLSSAWEGTPLVLLEAGSVGRPAVSTAVGGAPQIVVHGKTGLIVPSGDGAALGSSMCQIMQLPARTREAWGIAARAHIAEYFSVDAINQNYERLYRNILEAQS